MHFRYLLILGIKLLSNQSSMYTKTSIARLLIRAVFTIVALLPTPSFAILIAPCQGDTCTACDLVTLAQNVLNFGFIFGLLVSSLLFAYAGILYLSAATNPGNISKAHSIFWNVVVGFVILLSAWIAIDIIMKTLYGEGSTKWGPWNTILCRAGAPVKREVPTNSPPRSSSSSSSSSSSGALSPGGGPGVFIPTGTMIAP